MWSNISVDKAVHFRLLFNVNDFPQVLQLNGSSPVCIIQCPLSFLLSVNDFLLIPQMYGLSPVSKKHMPCKTDFLSK